MTATPERILEYLKDSARRCPDQFFCALVDTARNENGYKTLAESDCDMWCLLVGDLPLDLAEAAPYLVIFEEEAPLLETLVSRGWGDSWGIYLRASPPFEKLLDHLRSINTARLPDGEVVFFRYYDPRILRLYLPTCTRNELEIFFGPVTSFIMESSKRDGILEFRRRTHALRSLSKWNRRASRAAAYILTLEKGVRMTLKRVYYPSGLCQLFR